MEKKLIQKIWNDKNYFSKGKRGLIYLAEVNGKKYCVKTKNPDSDKENPAYFEAENNKRLNTIGVGPKFYYYDSKHECSIREFVQGLDLFDWIKENKNKKIFEKLLKKIILDLLDQCYAMDKARINKLELTHPHKDIIITKNNKPIIIDFERCKITNKPKNVSQFCQFLGRGKFSKELENQGIKLDSDKLLVLAQEYKQNNQDKKIFEKVKKEITKSS